MKELDVITFGEAMAMFVAENYGALHEVDCFTKKLAGAEVNVAIGLARLGLRTGWVSKVGTDSFGMYIMNQLRRENVNIENVLTDTQHPTGFQLKSKVKLGDPEVQYFRKGSAASCMSKEDFSKEYFLKAKHVHMTGIPLALSESMRGFSNTVLHTMKKEGRVISFDPNLRPSLWKSTDEMVEVINRFAFEAHYVLPGLEEGKILSGYFAPYDIASFYLDKGVTAVIIKLGENGAYYKTKNEEGTLSPIQVVTVVDTVGAGDGFSVGVISGLMAGFPIRDAVLRGNIIGAFAVQTQGDYEGYPNLQQLNEFMEKNL